MSSPGSISEACPLKAEMLCAERGERLARAFDAIDRDADFVNSSLWTAADAAVWGPERTVWVAFVDAHGSVVGTTALARVAATWRSGGAVRTLTWPAARLGRGFRPRWRTVDREVGRRAWLPALRRAFPDVRLHLPNVAADALPAPLPALPGVRCESGATRRQGAAGPDLAGHLARLAEAGAQPRTNADAPQPRSNADAQPRCNADAQPTETRAHPLEEGHARIEARGGRWHTHAPGHDLSPALAQVFALHRARMVQKGRPRAAFGADDRAFFAALAAHAPGLRLGLLEIDGKTAAGALAFVWHGRFDGYVAGWSAAHPDLDLATQVWWQPIRHELSTRGLAAMELRDDEGCETAFALTPHTTVDIRARPTPTGGLGAQLVGGVLQVFGRTRPTPREPEVPV